MEGLFTIGYRQSLNKRVREKIKVAQSSFKQSHKSAIKKSDRNKDE